MKKNFVNICLVIIFLATNSFAQELGEKVYKEVIFDGKKDSKWFRLDEISDYNENGKIIIKKDELGTETIYDYDKSDNLIHQKSIMLDKTNSEKVLTELWYEYDTGKNKTYQKVQMSESIMEWWYKYDAKGNNNYVKYKYHYKDKPDEITETWIDNDNYGNRIRANTSKSETTLWYYEYDARGNIIFKAETRGSSPTKYWYKYDENNNNIYEKQFSFIETEYWYRYDDRGNLIHKKCSDGSEELYEYEYWDNEKIKKHKKFKKYSFD